MPRFHLRQSDNVEQRHQEGVIMVGDLFDSNVIIKYQKMLTPSYSPRPS